MSWKEYQKKAGHETGQKSLSGRLLGFIALAALLICSYHWAEASWPFRSKVLPQPDFSFGQQKIPVEAIELGVKQVKMVQNGVDLTFDLSTNQSLQKFIDQKLKKYRLDWAGVAVLEPDTGRVLALSSYSSKFEHAPMLSLQASFPAASVFKMVTAGALLEETTQSSKSLFHYAGDMRKIRSRYLHRSHKGTEMSLSKAFANSANGIFGVIGSSYLDYDLLTWYAERFGFNQEIPFEIPVQTSIVETSTDSSVSSLHTAKLAAGFGNVTLSPLHGAMIASSVIMEGVMMRPYLLDHVTHQGRVLFEATPKVWKTPLSVKSARDMQSMMQHTVTGGTARKVFRHASRTPVIKGLNIGGKTGSLYGKNPRGRNEWFVSYAVDQATGKKLAVGVVIVNEKYWKIKPTQLAKWIYQEYFRPGLDSPVLASNKHGEKKIGS